MKLYTEEQVRKAMSSARIMLPRYDNDIMSSLTPIELPSDGDIEDYIERLPYMRDLPLNVKDGVISGAKWMKEQILKQD